MNVRTRRGFTLVELLVVVVLGGFIVLATYQVLITNSRTYAVNNARIQGQQTLRAGMDVLFSELREISTPQGDLIAMATDSVTFRAQRAIGLVCEVDYTTTPPKITTYRIGPLFAPGDSVWVFHDNNPNRAADDEWLGAVIQSVDNSANCNGEPAQSLRVPALGTYASAADPDSVRQGAVVRGFQTYTYGQYTIDGEAFLGRRLSSASDPDPLVGPVLAAGGVQFRYLDTLGVATMTATSVTQIEVILRYQSAVRNAQGALVGDTLVARVYTRN